MKLNPPRSQIKICEKRQTRNVQFRFMQNAFRILKPIQKSSKCVWVFCNTGARKNIKFFYFNGVNVAKHCHVAGRGICHLWLPCLSYSMTTILDIQMFIVMMSHWRTPSNCSQWHLVNIRNLPFHKGGGGGSIIDENIYFIFIFISKENCVTVLHTKIYCFRTRNKQLLKV